MNSAKIVVGRVGWANPDCGDVKDGLTAYGPPGRWQPQNRLIDGLTEAGVGEGAILVVVAVPRFGPESESVIDTIATALDVSSDDIHPLESW